MQDELFTIIGANGYIGSHLCRSLARRGTAVKRIDRYRINEHATATLGHVIFAAGITSDFRVRPFDTMQAHVGALADVLDTGRFESFLYLSSTRVYQGAASTDEEENLLVAPGDPLQLYNISKLAGEALCLALDRPRVRVARLSNVYGADDPSANFLIDIIRSAVATGQVELQTSLSSAKDFVSIADVTAILPELALRGRERLYNVASGHNTSYSNLLENLQCQTGCTVSVAPGSPVVWFPEISIRRLTDEFSVAPVSLSDDIANLIRDFKRIQP